MPELRKDPIIGRWVIISTDRAKRPSDFLRESVVIKGIGVCPFDHGNESKTPPELLQYGRNGSGPNTPGWQVRVVPNKFPALGIEGDLDREGIGLFDRMNGIGAHEVIVETPDHGATLATMTAQQIEAVLWAFRERMLDLKNDKRFRYILIFKNHGEAAGASLEHPHSQLIALPIVPKRVREEVDSARHYYIEKERCIFCDIIRQEIASGVRVIGQTELFVTLAPYAPRFPFEMWILPKRHASSFENDQAAVFAGLAAVLKDNLARLDAVLDRPAYNMMIHTSPIGEEINEHYHWHIEIIPKLTKVAGFEWGTGFYICPTPPEESARFMRDAQVVLTA
ncbi:MAG TPA: galactose-1-phosphate uridylyltransferase [Candidatus Dormibacteraeota bacterium]|nr:galactose-1-phosphate uridylyltransferase [Candidatus Dormibacteraeota bacterium]